MNEANLTKNKLASLRVCFSKDCFDKSLKIREKKYAKLG
jgi:hypothetical protein